MIHKIKRFRRLYYSPGLISIILLPILCLFYLKSNHVFEKYGVIDITFALPDTNDIFGKIPKRDYLEINLTGNDQEDKSKFDHAQSELRKLVYDSSGTKGVRFHFGEKAKYKTFISALNILSAENVRTYAPKDNDIWVAIPTHVKIIPDSLQLLFPINPCGTAEIQQRFLQYEHDAKLEEEKIIAEENYMTQVQKKLIIPSVLYVLMLFFAVKKLFF